MVAARFNLDQATLASLYTYDDYNVYMTNMNTRAMWKYAASKTVSGTPTAFINGVKVDDLPGSVTSWINLLDEIYGSQYKPVASRK